jgi:uncharacterized membrane protein YjgN (DUF898 family)
MSTNRTPVVFTGRTSEYFGIWIVNLLLSIMTLGIYSAWAKVRRKKYFYHNTLIDGVGFDYHANPIAILKGRVIAFVLYMIFLYAPQFLSPEIGLGVSGVLSILLFIAIPWIVVRGLKFNARNSSHRGLRFDFDGQYGKAALLFVGFPILFGSVIALIIFAIVKLASAMIAGLVGPLLVLAGLAVYIPFIMQRQQQFMVNHHKFGTTNFEMKAKMKDFFMIFLKLFLVVLALGTALSVIIALLFKSTLGTFMPHTALLNQPAYVQTLGVADTQQQSGFIKVANNQDTLTAEEKADLATTELEAQSNSEENLADESLSQDLTAEERVDFDKLLKQDGALDDAELTDDGEDNTKPAEKPQDEIEKALKPYAGLLGAFGVLFFFGFILLYLGVIFSFVAYIKSRVSNLVFNNTSIDHIGFHSDQRMRDLLLIYVTNAIVLMFTMGFATPWAHVRLAKYRAEHLSLIGEADWDHFIGEKKEAAKATGEEIADFFDVDLSFGF